MVRVCVGCWHLMKWCSFRLTVVCVCVSGAFVCFCRVGWRPRVGWWPRFCLVFRGSKGTVRHPEKQRFWSRFGSQLGGVLAQKGVVFFDACGGFRWSVCVLGAGT